MQFNLYSIQQKTMPLSSALPLAHGMAFIDSPVVFSAFEEPSLSWLNLLQSSSGKLGSIIICSLVLATYFLRKLSFQFKRYILAYIDTVIST